MQFIHGFSNAAILTTLEVLKQYLAGRQGWVDNRKPNIQTMPWLWDPRSLANSVRPGIASCCSWADHLYDILSSRQ